MSSNDYFLSGRNIPKEGIPAEEGKRSVSPFILKQLKSRDPEVVAIGIQNMVDDPAYLKEEVCELLVGLLRKGPEHIIELSAGDGLISALRGANPAVSARTLKGGLFAVNDTNGRLLSRIIAEPLLAGEIRKAAMDLLDKYREGEIGEGTLREIERLLDAAVSNKEDDPRITKQIAAAFGLSRIGRPRISSMPPPPANWKPKNTPQLYGGQLVVGAKKPVKA